MPDLRGLVEYMVESEQFARVINNPLAAFGTPVRKYLGAELLPEHEVPENAYTEEAIKYRTIVANSSTRYSPVQLKEGSMVGTMNVVLGNSDAGSQFTGQDYDALIRILERFTGTAGMVGGGVNRPDFQAMEKLTQWADMTLNRPLLELNEKNRWQAICLAVVTLTGDNGYTETVNYPNPAGARVTAGGTWSNNAYDPWADIIGGAEFLKTLGYGVNRIITGTDVRTKLSNNSNVKLRAGHLAYNVGAAAVVPVIAGHVPLKRLGELLDQDGLPPIELYDLQYRTSTTSNYFFPRGTMVLCATTDRDASIDLGDYQNLFERGQGINTLSMPSTLGYVGIGRAAGHAIPGRQVFTEAFANKPPRVEGQAWQASLPVVTEPQAIYVISGIA